MRHVIFPFQDASIYSEHENQNTGLDEVLEIGKTDEGRGIVRSLIQFDLPSDIPAAAKYELVLYTALASKLKLKQGVELCHTSQSWEEGSGYYHQTPISTQDGVTWTQNSSGSSWPSGSLGGSIISGFSITKILPKDIGTLTFDVTTLVRAWVSQSVPNNGLIIKFTDAAEADVKNAGNIKVFSAQTHTIWQPKLVAKWDDQVYVSGSDATPTGALMLHADVKHSYYPDTVNRVRVTCRSLYPTKTFNNSPNTFSASGIVPPESFYSVVDVQTGEAVIPFGEDTKISVNNGDNWFDFKVQHMYPRRWYRVLLKTVRNGLEEIFDSSPLFTVSE